MFKGFWLKEIKHFFLEGASPTLNITQIIYFSSYLNTLFWRPILFDVFYVDVKGRFSKYCKSGRVRPIKLKIGMVYHRNNIFGRTDFWISVSEALNKSEFLLRKGLEKVQKNAPSNV